MESTLGYIIIFGLIIIFTLIYLSKREKEKIFSLTKKMYSFGTFDVLIKKSGKDFQFFILKIQSSETIDLNQHKVLIEFQNKNKSDTAESLPIPSELIILSANNEYFIRFEPLSDFIKQYRKIHEPFRFGIELNSSRKMKSGYIAFNKYWKVYVPDSGSYN